MARKAPAQSPGAMTTSTGKTAVVSTFKPTFAGRATKRGGKGRGGRRR